MVDRNENFEVLQEIGNLAHDGVIIYDFDKQKIVYSNPAASRLTGLKANDSRPEIELLMNGLQAEDQSYVRERFLEAHNGAVISDVECRLRSNEEEVHLCCDGYPVSGGNAMVIGIRDITKRKQYETYLVDFGAKKDVLLDSLTHYISGAMSLVRDLTQHTEKRLEGHDNSDLDRYFSLVNENCRLCIDIINDLMAEEHLQSPTVSVKRARTDVVQLAYRIFQQVKNLRGGKFFFHSPVPSLFLHTDEVKLMQVINNLSSNAVKFTPDDEEIRFEIQRTATDVIISIADKGIGIPEHLKPLIFERHGAGRPGLNGEKSLGIGLSVCKTLVHLIGGQIWFESTEGEGSTFFVRLPVE